jgi:Zn-finger nucleic acid-binding protein
MQLTCPKCQSDMRQYERNGVIVDQCMSCRGLFLDNGELEKLSSAAQEYYAPEPSRGSGYGPPRNAPVSPVSGPPAYGYGRGHGDDRYEGHGYGHGHYKKKKKRSFFEDLLGD